MKIRTMEYSQMKKALLISISIMMLTVLISCNGNSAPAPSEEEDPGTGSPEAETAPVPVFLTGIQQQSNPLMLLSEGSNEEAGMSEEMCYMFYKLFVGAPAIVGFEGNTSDKEISTTIFDSPVTFSWNEENGVYTYEGTDGKTISATIIYNSKTQSYDYQQVIKSSYASQDYYVISMASDIQYSKETGWDGNYKAYISGGPALIDGGQYYMFNNICSGTFHSGDNATGVFTYKMIQDFKSNDTLEADSDKLFSYDTTIDQASGIVSKMEEFMTPSVDTEEKDIRSNYSYQILYSRNGRYEVYPPTNGPETDPEAQRAACLEYLPQISGNWQLEDSDIPHTSAQVDA